MSSASRSSATFPPAARSKRIVSTSALPEGLDPAGIDAVVKERMAAGEDLYRLDRGIFADLDPDLVVTQDLCAVCAVDVSTVDDAIAYLGCRAEVLTLDPMTLDEVLDSILDVGAATGTETEAARLVERSRSRLDATAALVDGGRTTSDTGARVDRPCVHSRTLGARPRHRGRRRMPARPAWPTLGRHRMVDDRIVGRRGRDRRAVWLSPRWRRGAGQDVVRRGVLPPGAEVWAVDADAVVVRPGPRVVDGVELFASILHPDLAGEPDPLGVLRI